MGLFDERTNEASKLLRGFIAMVKNQFNKGVKVVKSDNGAEFTSRPMQEFYLEHGTLLKSSCVDTPQKNGRAECKKSPRSQYGNCLTF